MHLENAWSSFSMLLNRLLQVGLSKVLSSLGGLGLSYGAEAAISRLRKAAGLSETGLLVKTGLLYKK